MEDVLFDIAFLEEEIVMTSFCIVIKGICSANSVVKNSRNLNDRFSLLHKYVKSRKILISSQNCILF